MSNYNEITINKLNALDVVPNGWCTIKEIDIENKEICFKLKIWDLQCKLSKKILDYIHKVNYGVNSKKCFNELVLLNYGLQFLNQIDPKELDNLDFNLNKLFLKLKI